VPEDGLLPDEAAPLSTTTTTATTTAAATFPPALAELLGTAADPALTEDFALALLKRADLPAEVLEQFGKNVSVLKSRKVKMALATHARTPRHVSVPLARQFYTFDLMKLALSPLAPADVRVAVDNMLISRLQTVTVGERLTLARRASGRVAAALLLEVAVGGGKTAEAKLGSAEIRTEIKTTKTNTTKTNTTKTNTTKTNTTKIKTKIKAVSVGTGPRERRVMQTALDNPRLTEALVINSVLRPDAGADLVHAVARHPKWSRRKEIRAALLRTEHLSLARALEFSEEIPVALLQELLNSSRLPAKIKNQLARERLA
jgi:hypothetical protein